MGKTVRTHLPISINLHKYICIRTDNPPPLSPHCFLPPTPTLTLCYLPQLSTALEGRKLQLALQRVHTSTATGKNK